MLRWGIFYSFSEVDSLFLTGRPTGHPAPSPFKILSGMWHQVSEAPFAMSEWSPTAKLAQGNKCPRNNRGKNRHSPPTNDIRRVYLGSDSPFLDVRILELSHKLNRHNAALHISWPEYVPEEL